MQLTLLHYFSSSSECYMSGKDWYKLLSSCTDYNKYLLKHLCFREEVQETLNYSQRGTQPPVRSRGQRRRMSGENPPEAGSAWTHWNTDTSADFKLSTTPCRTVAPQQCLVQDILWRNQGEGAMFHICVNYGQRKEQLWKVRCQGNWDWQEEEMGVNRTCCGSWVAQLCLTLLQLHGL